jgi:integrase/recombinase XerD
VVRVQRVRMSKGQVSYTVVGRDGVIEPVDRYLAFLTDIERSPNTLDGYATDLKLFFEHLELRKLDWTRVTLEDVGTFVAWLRRTRSRQSTSNLVVLGEPPKGRDTKTVNRILAAVFGFYEHQHVMGAPLTEQLIRHRLAHRDYKGKLQEQGGPRPATRPIRLPEERKLPQTLTEEQVLAILDACAHLRDRLLIALWWLAGLRVGQTLGLRHEDVDGRRKEIKIVPRRDNANGARAKVTQTHLIPILPELVQLHADYLHEEYGELDSDYLFVNLWSKPLGQPMTYGAVDALVRRLRRRSGVWFTPHMMRHTFATERSRDGLRLEVVSRLLTHKHLQTTNDIYVHLDVEDLRRELVLVRQPRLRVESDAQ